MEIRQFNIREADWETDGNQLSNIRRIVFIVEQEVPQEEEWDGKDEDSWHWIATDREDAPIGTARLLPDGQIGRMAVLQEHRKFGVGAALLEAAVEKARHLGFDSVFLNAQTHALGFYERCGFVVDESEDEFMEAGIPHRRMIQVLSPPDDNIQRRQAVAPELAMDVKPFDTSEVLWRDAHRPIKRVRKQVFQTELGLDSETEDDDDKEAIHWVASNDDERVVGSIRMLPTGEVSQLAVIDDYRHQGIGSSLVELAVQRARRFSLSQLSIDARPDASAFLNHVGFESAGDSRYIRQIDPEDMAVQTRDNPGETVPDDITYRLGEDKQLILLRRESDFRNIILEMTRQARYSIRIYSPLLDHDLFDVREFQDICSALARRNKRTYIEVLVFDPHRMIKNGHVLLNIARRLPSSIGIKIVDPEMRQKNHEFVLVDGKGYVYRQEYETYEGTACFNDVTETNRLNRIFTASWESGLLDPNIRQLRV